jgi:hypothetical protein
MAVGVPLDAGQPALKDASGRGPGGAGGAGGTRDLGAADSGAQTAVADAAGAAAAFAQLCNDGGAVPLHARLFRALVAVGAARAGRPSPRPCPRPAPRPHST